MADVFQESFKQAKAPWLNRKPFPAHGQVQKLMSELFRNYHEYAPQSQLSEHQTTFSRKTLQKARLSERQKQGYRTSLWSSNARARDQQSKQPQFRKKTEPKSSCVLHESYNAESPRTGRHSKRPTRKLKQHRTTDERLLRTIQNQKRTCWTNMQIISRSK